MANIFKMFFDSMKFSEEDDEYEDYVNEQEEKERKKSEIQASPERVYQTRDFSPKASEQPRNVSNFEDRKTKAVSDRGKVVQFRNSSYREELGLYVCKPTAFSDCQEISDILVSGTAVVINLEGFDDELAQRIMDFVSGTVYAINGKLNTISKRIYIVSPESVTISGNVESVISHSGVDAPTISRDF